MGNICGSGDDIDRSYRFESPYSNFTKSVHKDGGDFPKINVKKIGNPIIRFEKQFPFHRMNIANFRQIIYYHHNKNGLRNDVKGLDGKGNPIP
jgi:hypothetical protein